MSQCEHCNTELPPGRRQRFCSNECGTAYHNAHRSEPKQMDVETPPIHQAAQRLVVGGFMPEPFNVDPHDQRPLWDICGIAALLDQRPEQLVQLLVENGPVHLQGDKGIPSSWRLLVER